MAGRLAGKVAIVTGAAQGAGWGAAYAMAAEGASIVLVGRTRAKLERASDELLPLGIETFVAPCDVTGAPGMAGVVADTVAQFGAVDVLVCAAQAPDVRSGSLLETGDSFAEELWRSGPLATLSLMKACHPHMVRRGGGSIITFASGAMHSPAGYGVYAGCKAAILTISRAAAVEWGPDGIRVNTVSPLVLSPSLEIDVPADVQDAVARRLPLRHIGDPEEIGRAVAFLASDDASYVTGNLLTLDGGSWHTR
jgi:NAD(P)-dependent dehydrogenase (short-subunit alcohol dehydrogenase family)